MNWVVIKTLCYPAQWKVTFMHDGRDAGDNGTSNFFREYSDAHAEAKYRNDTDNKMCMYCPKPISYVDWLRQQQGASTGHRCYPEEAK